MTQASNSEVIPAMPRTHDWLPALLSYLVPGLGQIYQGRVAKGLVFMISLYGLFIYGMYLGSFSNVFLPVKLQPEQQEVPILHLGGLPAHVFTRLSYAGQFWIGIAAWPALWQYASPSKDPDAFQRDPGEKKLNELQSKGDKTWDLGLIYTVIAGVLNILVIYDAFAGPAFLVKPKEEVAAEKEAVPA